LVPTISAPNRFNFYYPFQSKANGTAGQNAVPLRPITFDFCYSLSPGQALSAVTSLIQRKAPGQGKLTVDPKRENDGPQRPLLR
jgi:hypothetical protein